MKEADLKAAIDEYNAVTEAAAKQRDDRIRAARDEGWLPVEIQRVTGYSRETVRQILMTDEDREKFRARRRKPKKAADKQPR